MFYRKEGQHSKLTLSCYLMQKQYDLIITCGSTVSERESAVKNIKSNSKMKCVFNGSEGNSEIY